MVVANTFVHFVTILFFQYQSSCRLEVESRAHRFSIYTMYVEGKGQNSVPKNELAFSFSHSFLLGVRKKCRYVMCEYVLVRLKGKEGQEVKGAQESGT